MDGYNFERLKTHIMELSQSSDFIAARSEWDLVHIEISEEFDHCPCGQSIKEHCYIRNRVTGKETYVGNVCINKFLGIDTGNLFAGLKRIQKDVEANANEAVIEYANKLGILSAGDYKFLHDTKLKKKPSEKQLAWKVKLNRRILAKIAVMQRGDIAL